MLILIENAIGLAIFRLLDEEKLQQFNHLYLDFETPDSARKIIQLQFYEEFNNITDAFAATKYAVQGMISPRLEDIILQEVVKNMEGELLLDNSRMGQVINNRFGIQCISDIAVQELIRCLRLHLHILLKDTPKGGRVTVEVIQSTSKYIETVPPTPKNNQVVNIQGLVETIEKSVEVFTKRLYTWYRFHFPEFSELIHDNRTFVDFVKLVGHRRYILDSDLSKLVSVQVEDKLVVASQVSTGGDISELEAIYMKELAAKIIKLYENRDFLANYLKHQKNTTVPSLTAPPKEDIGPKNSSAPETCTKRPKTPPSTPPSRGFDFRKSLLKLFKTKKGSRASKKRKFKNLAAKLSLVASMGASTSKRRPLYELESKRKADKRKEKKGKKAKLDESNSVCKERSICKESDAEPTSSCSKTYDEEMVFDTDQTSSDSDDSDSL